MYMAKNYQLAFTKIFNLALFTFTIIGINGVSITFGKSIITIN